MRNRMKVQGTGFSYYLDNKECKDFDSWEKAIKNIDVETEVEGLEIRAKTIKK